MLHSIPKVDGMNSRQQGRSQDRYSRSNEDAAVSQNPNKNFNTPVASEFPRIPVSCNRHLIILIARRWWREARICGALPWKSTREQVRATFFAERFPRNVLAPQRSFLSRTIFTVTAVSSRHFLGIFRPTVAETTFSKSRHIARRVCKQRQRFHREGIEKLLVAKMCFWQIRCTIECGYLNLLSRQTGRSYILS